MKKALAGIAVLLLVVLAGCSGGVTTKGNDAAEGGPDAGDQDWNGIQNDGNMEIAPPDGAVDDSGGNHKDQGPQPDGDVAATPDTLPDVLPDVAPDVPFPGVTVTTYTDLQTVPAGIPLQVDCQVTGLAEGSYVTYLQISGPADVDVADLAITFHKVGKYNVACRAKWKDGEVVDETPVTITVTPGNPATIDTGLSSSNVKAGETVLVTCAIEDAYANKIDLPAKVAVNPQVGLDLFGMKIVAIKVGTYQVACVEPVSGLQDVSPATLTVVWGVPKKIETTLEKDTIVAGQSTKVSCKTVDAFGNVVPDYPVAVFLSPGLSLQGFNVTGTKAGAYQVICVPQNEEWEYFILTPRLLKVLPGPAVGVSLQAIPDKPVYFMFETVQFIVSAVDQYGNPVDGVKLLPLACEPNDPGILNKGELKYKFETEGIFLFQACLEENPKVCGQKEINIDGYGPVITIKFPSRGATLQGKPSVNVAGNVIDPVSGIASFTINGKKVPLDENGDFVYPITAVQGMNLIVAVAEDPNGFKTWLVQAFYYSPVWFKVDINDPEGSKFKDGILFHLADEFFDKLPHDYSKPDNLSIIVEMALKKLDLGSFLPNPVASAGPYKVYLGPFSYGPPVVHLDTITGGLLAEVHIYEVKVHVEAKGTCKVLFIDFCPDVSGDVLIDEIQMWEGLNVWVENGQVKMSKYENFIGLYGLEVNIDGILGFLFGWLVDWFVGSYTQTLEQTAMKMVDEQVQAIAGGLLQQLALNQQLSMANPLNPNAPPVELSLVASIRELIFSHTGVEVRLDAAVLSPKNINKNPLGSIGRASCLKWVPENFVMDKEKFAIMAIHDDLINEVLFASWWAGLLDMQLPVDQFLDPAALKDYGINSLEDLGIKDITARTEFFLPPIITSCNDSFDKQLQMQVGDMYIELKMKMLNEPVTMGMFVSMAAEAQIEIVDNNGVQELSLGIGKIDPMVAQVTYISDNLKGAEVLMSMIIQGMLLPQLLGSFANNVLTSFPLPEIDLSSMSTFLPPNIVWKFVVDKFWRELGFNAMIAHIEAK